MFTHFGNTLARAASYHHSPQIRRTRCDRCRRRRRRWTEDTFWIGWWTEKREKKEQKGEEYVPELEWFADARLVQVIALRAQGR